MQSSLAKHIRNTIASHKTGWVFTHVDFFSQGNEATIERILSRLFEAGEIRRIRRGLYYKTEISRWGRSSPCSFSYCQRTEPYDENQIFT